MKKLLLAAAILAISATAMGVEPGNTATASLTVSANYIVPITVALDVNTVNFKDVYVGSDANAKTVNATITGESGEAFNYSVTTTSNKGVIISGGSGTITDGISGTGTVANGVANFDFGIDVDRSSVKDDIVNQNIVVTVEYSSIDDSIDITPVVTPEA